MLTAVTFPADCAMLIATAEPGAIEGIVVSVKVVYLTIWGLRIVARIVHGERIGQLGAVMFGCVAVVFDPTRCKILLTRRTDNGRWCLPGGRLESGESVTEACVREVWEETGLQVRVTRLIGVYSNPHQLLEYADGNRYHPVSVSLEAEPFGGTLALSDETTEFGYFTHDEIIHLDVMEHHHERIGDAFVSQSAAFVR